MSEVKVCPVCQEMWIEGDLYCRFCGMKIHQPISIEPDFACIYGPMPEVRKHKCEKCGFSWDTVLMFDNEKYCPQCGGRAPILSDFHVASLLQIQTRDTVAIGNWHFTIGRRGGNVDYAIENDGSVSRTHAVIVTRDRRSYVRDLGSKNHTYLNGELLPPQKEVEICNGDVLKIGHGQYIFCKGPFWKDSSPWE